MSAADLLRRLRIPRATIDRVTLLVREHMWSYEPAWSDAAVRRFIRKVGPDAIDELFAPAFLRGGPLSRGKVRTFCKMICHGLQVHAGILTGTWQFSQTLTA